MKKLLILLLLVTGVSFSSCIKKKCQTCNLVYKSGEVYQEGEEYCQEELHLEDQADCNEREALHNYYIPQTGLDSAFCECTIEEK